ncbi:MAG: hypothetical protein ACI7YS_14755 [Flavobacterium sp.]
MKKIGCLKRQPIFVCHSFCYEVKDVRIVGVEHLAQGIYNPNRVLNPVRVGLANKKAAIQLQLLFNNCYLLSFALVCGHGIEPLTYPRGRVSAALDR